MAKYELASSDLTDNPTARVPICLVVDTSASMGGEPIKELMDGIIAFQKSLHEDDIAKWAAEVCIIGFGAQVSIIQDFSTLHNNLYIPQLTASGNTPMGAAVTLALDNLEKRKSEYKKVGVDYYQPWLVLMSDGEPTDLYTTAATRSKEMAVNKKLTVFPIGIGASANLAKLSEFSAREALPLKGLNFKAFFQWLSKSVSVVSRSTPGANIPLDQAGIKGWAEL
jgi:uncharacterized protein YegL